MSDAANQQLAESEAKLRSADLQIANDPTNAMWYWRRGAALASVGDFARAREAAAKAISLLPGYADAWVLLGEIHGKLGDRKAAKRAFRSAVDIDPLTEGAIAGYLAHSRLPEFLAWGLRTALQERWRKFRRHQNCPGLEREVQEAVDIADRGHVAAAIDVLRRAMSRCPGSVYIAKYLGGYLAMHGNHQQSRRLLEKIVAWWPKDPQAHFVYGVCLMALGDQPASVAALKRALALDPDNHEMKVALAVAGGKAPPAPNLIQTRGVFDNYADRFDTHLVERLNYRVPEKLAGIFALNGCTWDRMLDLGCGTGLTGASMRPYARHLTGVDLSQGMLDKAKARGVYDTLYRGDCVAFLRQIEATYDVMVSLDVLIYFGDLTDLFHAVRARLSPGGIFWFSVEEHVGEGYGVMLSQRYQHSLSYIRATAEACGLAPLHEQKIDIRMESYKPVPGLLVALQRPPDSVVDKSWQFQPDGVSKN